MYLLLRICCDVFFFSRRIKGVGGEGNAEPEEACRLGHPLPVAGAHQEQCAGHGLLGEERVACAQVEGRPARPQKDEGIGVCMCCCIAAVLLQWQVKVLSKPSK